MNSMPRHRYIHYGGSYAGPAPKEFLNFDASPTLRLERVPLFGSLIHKNPTRFPLNVMYGDITKGPLVHPGTAKGVYCSHVLEHLSYRDCQLALKYSFSMLASGGIFRFVFPDLNKIARDYVAGRIDANEFMKESGLGEMSRSKGAKGFVKSFFGNSAHLWLWDENSIREELAKAGFGGIRRACFGDSPDPMFSLVESKGRWEGQLGIECYRP